MELKKRLLMGEKVCGTMLRIGRNPAIACIAKNAGLDFFMFDCEHGHFSFETMHDIFVTANALGVTGMVRVPNLAKEYISRALDSGARGVMVPMIETPEQAKMLVKYAKYQPIGDRGYSGGGANTDYAGGEHMKVMADANDRVIAIAQIETALAVENARDIASVEGIDALLIGPNDLSISLGIPGDLLNPIELEAIAKVAEACREKGKLFGLHAGPALQDKFAKDLDIVMQGGDADILKTGFAQIKKYCDQIKQG